MNPNKQRITLLKCHLYGALLEKPKELLTDSEVNIMYELVKDEEIQDILNRRLKEGR